MREYNKDETVYVEHDCLLHKAKIVGIFARDMSNSIETQYIVRMIDRIIPNDVYPFDYIVVSGDCIVYQN